MWPLVVEYEQCGRLLLSTNSVAACCWVRTVWPLVVEYERCGRLLLSTNSVAACC